MCPNMSEFMTSVRRQNMFISWLFFLLIVFIQYPRAFSDRQVLEKHSSKRFGLENSTPIDGTTLTLVEIFDKKYPALQNKTIPHTTKRMVMIYQMNHKHTSIEFGNAADFFFAPRVSQVFAKALNQSAEFNLIIVVAGLNHGALLIEIMKCLPPNRFQAHGFEIDQINIRKAQQHLAPYSEVKIHLLGVSNQSTTLSVGGVGQVAGLYDEHYVSNKMTARSSNWKRRRKCEYGKKLSRIDYLVIDVEGHETIVLQGMQLDQLHRRKQFAVFQMELGGTWSVDDPRHPKGAGTLYETISYLIGLGYRLYLIGMRTLLPVDALFFLYAPIGDSQVVEGNILVIHPEYANKELLEYVERFHQIEYVDSRLKNIPFPIHIPTCDMQ